MQTHVTRTTRDVLHSGVTMLHELRMLPEHGSVS